jgi:hypothetical protein
MATTNEFSDVYISDLDGSNKIYMDKSPEAPPFVGPAKGVSQSVRCLPGLDGSSNLAAGKLIHWDGGADETDGIITWSCTRMLQPAFDALLIKWNSPADVRVSLDDGDNIYRCQWTRPDGFAVSKGRGRSSYDVKFSFRVVSKF